MDAYGILKTDLISILRLAERTLLLTRAQIDLSPGFLGQIKAVAPESDRTLYSADFVDPIASELAQSVMRYGEIKTLESGMDHAEISSHTPRDLDRIYVGLPLISIDRMILGCMTSFRHNPKEMPEIDRDSLAGFAHIISRRLTQFEEQRFENIDSRTKKYYEHSLMTLGRELRKPLNPMLIETTSLIEDSDDPAWLLYLFRMKRNIEQICDRLDKLEGLDRKKPSAFRSNINAIDLHHLISEMVSRADSEMTSYGSSIICKLEARDHLVRSDRAPLERVILNCLTTVLRDNPNSNGLETRVETSNLKPGLVHLQIYTAPKSTTIPSSTATTTERVILDPVGHEPAKTVDPILEIATAVFNAYGVNVERIVDDREVTSGYRIALPLSLNPSVQSSIPELPADPGTIAETQAPPPTRILLVEDNPDTLRYLTGFLQSKGYEVTQASTIAEAIERSRVQAFDALVSDIELPDGSGLALKRERELVGIPGVAMSGFGAEEDLLASRDAGFHTHLIKPLNVRKLHESIVQAVFEANSSKIESV